MTVDDIITALELPEAARVERRVPKTLLLEHGAPTAADKRRISEGVEQIHWLAALKPTTIGLPVYRDEDREYLEIAVLRASLRPAAKAARLRDLIHRAIPYPVFAVTVQADRATISLAHKRRSQGESDKTVLDGGVVSVEAPSANDPHDAAFATALALSNQPRTSIWSLYDGWVDVLVALHAARRTGHFAISTNRDRRVARRQALEECARLDAKLARLRTAAAKEKQMARQVALNLELKHAEAARQAALERL